MSTCCPSCTESCWLIRGAYGCERDFASLDLETAPSSEHAYGTRKKRKKEPINKIMT